MPNATTDELLCYLFKDNSLNTTNIPKDISTNWALQQKQALLLESIEALQLLPIKKPRARTVEAILAYAISSKASELV